MDTASIQTALGKVIDRNPKLSDNGWDYNRFTTLKDFNLKADREQLRRSVVMVEGAMAYLRTLPRLSAHSCKWRNSYELKHTAEQEWPTGSYITNGALIAAALILGIDIKVSPASPNPLIAVGGTGVWD